MELKQRVHFDEYQPSKWLTVPFKKTPEGYLKGRAIVTNTGVFVYSDGNGGVVRELRPPEEVFNPDSLESLKMKPVTNDHPSVLVDSSNIGELQVGHLGDNPSSTTQFNWAPKMEDVTDGYHLAIDMVITKDEAIKDIEMNKKRALSCGYTCDLEKAEEGANWCGMDYDYIQRNIRYNHVAVVDRARAGDAARIRMDSVRNNDILISFEEEGMELKTITLDGVEYKAEAEVLKNYNMTKTALDELTQKHASLVTEKSKIEGERDNLKDQVANLTKDHDELKAKFVDASKVDELVKERLRIMDTAKKLEVEVTDVMTNLDVMKAVIVKKFPSAKLDDKDATYIQARFDGIQEMLDAEAQLKADADARKQKDSVSVQDADESADAKRKKMIEDLNKKTRSEKK